MKYSVNNISQKGFTLIELLVVIAIMGVLAVGVILAIDPVDKINAANDAKVQGDIESIGKAAEACAVKNGGTDPVDQAAILTCGELKSPLTPPTGYGAAYTVVGTNPAGGSTFVAYGTLKSKKYTTTPVFIYDRSFNRANVCASTSPQVGC